MSPNDDISNVNFTDPDVIAFIKWKSSNTYEEFLQWCHDELLIAIEEIESHRDSLSEDTKDEDDCTDIIATHLKARTKLITGVNIEREALSSGHCDLTIKKDKFTWLCEAKIYKGPKYILNGHNQLVERYLAGTNKYNSDAGMLIYFKVPLGDQITKCKEELANLPATITLYSDDYPLHYKSQLLHPHTSLNVQVVYFNVSLNHQSQKTKKLKN